MTLQTGLNVQPLTALALFKRSLALLYFCAEEQISEHYVSDGEPSVELLIAASQVEVFDPAGDGIAASRPMFDPVALVAACERYRA